MLHGPTLCSWNVTPSGPAHAECTILAGIAAKLPAFSAVPPVYVACSPIPTLSVPEKTVTCSMTECQCGGMRYPAGNRSRNVNGTASAGFPSSSTNSAPAGSDGGPGAHARLGACATITCDAGAGAAGVWAPSAAGTSAAATSAAVQRSDMTASKEWVPERSPRSGHRTNTKFLYITLVKAYDQLTKPGLTLHRLELFLAVLDSGGVARAAQARHLSQPAVSEHVRGLEAFFGVQLFERAGRGVRATAAARLIEPFVRQALGLVKSAGQAAIELRGLR